AESPRGDERVDTDLAIDRLGQRTDVTLILRRLLARHVDERRRGALVAEVAEHLHRDALLRGVLLIAQRFEQRAQAARADAVELDARRLADVRAAVARAIDQPWHVAEV